MDHKAIASEEVTPDVMAFYHQQIYSGLHNNLQINNIYLVCFFRKMGYNHNECSKGSRTVILKFKNLDMDYR